MPTQTVLRVHFLNGVAVGALSSRPRHQRWRDHSEGRGAADRAERLGHGTRHVVLTLRRRGAGRLLDLYADLSSPVLDPFFDHVTFSFKAGCPSDLDCEPAGAVPAARGATRRRSTISPRTFSASARRCWISPPCATRSGRSVPKPISG